MPKNLKASGEWEENPASKKSKISIDSLTDEILQTLSHFNDPNGSTFTSIAKHLESKGIEATSYEVRECLKLAVSSSKIFKPNNARWKIVESKLPESVFPISVPLQMGVEEPENTSFAGLPRDIAAEIMNHLSLQEIFKLRRVSKGWLGLTESRKLWKFLDFNSYNIAELPIHVVNLLVELAANYLDTFTIDGKIIYSTNKDLNMIDVIHKVVSNVSSLRHFEAVDIIDIPLQHILECKNIVTLTLSGESSNGIQVKEVNEINTSLPNLRHLSFLLNGNKKQPKGNRKIRISQNVDINWNTKLESLSIETDGTSFYITVPSHGLKSFSIYTNIFTGFHLTTRYVTSFINNLKDLFTDRLVHIELIDCTNVGSDLFSYLEERSPNVEVVRCYFNGSWNLGNNTLKSYLPELKEFRMLGGGPLDLTFPNLEIFSIDSRHRSICKLKAPKLKEIYFNDDYRSNGGGGEWQNEILSQANLLNKLKFSSLNGSLQLASDQLSDLTINWGNLHSTIFNDPKFNHLKYLNLQNVTFTSDSFRCEIPNLETLILKCQNGQPMKLDLNVPSLKILDLSGYFKIALTDDSRISNLSLVRLVHDSIDLGFLKYLNPEKLELVERTMQSSDLDDIVLCKSLKSLSFETCTMTDKGVIRFAEALTSKLTSLTLICDPNDDEHVFTDKSIYAIAKSCTELQQIGLSYCPLITSGALRDLILACKKIKCIRINQSPKISKASLLKGWTYPKWSCYINGNRVQ